MSDNRRNTGNRIVQCDLKQSPNPAPRPQQLLKIRRFAIQQAAKPPSPPVGLAGKHGGKLEKKTPVR